MVVLVAASPSHHVLKDPLIRPIHVTLYNAVIESWNQEIKTDTLSSGSKSSFRCDSNHLTLGDLRIAVNLLRLEQPTTRVHSSFKKLRWGFVPLLSSNPRFPNRITLVNKRNLSLTLCNGRLLADVFAVLFEVGNYLLKKRTTAAVSQNRPSFDPSR